jgi:hypothetical protein
LLTASLRRIQLEKAAAANQINEEATTPNQTNEPTTPNQTNEATPVNLMIEEATPVNLMIEEAQNAIRNEPPMSPPLHNASPEDQKPKLKIKKRPTKLQVATENAPDIAGDEKPVSKKESMIRLINRRKSSHRINVT